MGVTSSRVRALASAVLTLGIAAALIGCAADAEELPAEGPRTEPTPSAEQDPGEQQAPEAAAECLVGSWQLVNASFEAALAELVRDDPALPADIRADLSIALEGQSSLRFGGDGAYGAWQDEFTMIIGTRGEQMRHTQSSADIARYEVEGTRVRVTDFEQLFVEAQMRLGDSIAVAMPNGNASMASISFFGHTADVATDARELLDGSAQYTCSADTLTLQADGFPSAAEFSRVADIVRD